ncbi:MAG: hypothetical protein HQL23_00900 [Candidatus Omnitrophica bacterium]|nr:hypothetical protein [Candidatus Omnitrophota bacterium]
MLNAARQFGLDPKTFPPNCVFAPLVSAPLLAALGIPKLNKGFIFSAGIGKHCALIQTRVGAAFAGDALLLLKDSPIKNYVLFGSCGLIASPQERDSAALFCPVKSLARESFSRLLKKQDSQPDYAEPDQTLCQKILALSPAILPATCATVGSLYLETIYHADFCRDKVDIVDMECSAFFNAARYCQRQAAALFYASDHVGLTDPYLPPDAAADKIMKKNHNIACICLSNLVKSI